MEYAKSYLGIYIACYFYIPDWISYLDVGYCSIGRATAKNRAGILSIAATAHPLGDATS